MTLRRALFVLGAVLVGVNVATAIWDLRNDRAHVERNALRNFSNLTAALAEQTSRSLESVDLLLNALANEMRRSGIGDPAARTALLRERISSVPQVYGLRVITPDGHVLLSTEVPSPVELDVSERAYFTKHRDGAVDRRVVSDPYFGRVSGRWQFAISQRLPTDDGGFAGLLVALVDVAYFDRLYRSLDMGEGGFVSLFTSSGTLITKVPGQRASPGEHLSIPDDVLTALQRDGHFAGWTRSLAEAQADPVLVSAAAISDLPLQVYAGSPEHAVLEPWRNEAWRIAARTLLTSAVVLALVALAVRELTRRERADARVREGETRLRRAEKMEAVGRLASGIAHDFNNILGGILGYGEMILESAQEGSAMQRYAKNLLSAANRARDLVDQILTYTRSQRVERTPVDISRAVRETLDLVRGSLDAGIELVQSLPDEPLVVVGDATQLHQVVMNLCTNAAHAMNGSGTLRVALASHEVRQARVLAHGVLAPGRYVQLTVSDTGSGMDGSTLARIFEPFFTTKEVGRGTGLGLALVYGIVTNSGGAIHLTSELGRGSRFEIYLPQSVAPILAADAKEASTAQGRGERVLLVDDEEPLLEMTTELLVKLGYRPAPFSDGAAALAAFERSPDAFDMMLADEMMPGLTGSGLAQAVHALRPDLPIVLMSGYASPKLTEVALRAGVSEVLKKPVQSRELAAALARVLGRAGR
jgi:signal transduction histidine kinase/ActR/RegA family two-component response regulator